MAAAVVFRLVADDSLASDPHTVTPGTLYRGMAQTQEYHELYAKNEGADALVNPSHTLTRVTAVTSSLGSRCYRKVTDGPAGATLIDYDAETLYTYWGWPSSTANTVMDGPTKIADSMDAAERFDLWTKYSVGPAETLQTVQFKHLIGGS